jgi:putative DNA primase/helicase
MTDFAEQDEMPVPKDRTRKRSTNGSAASATAEQLPAGVSPFTDLGNAHRLQLEHGADLRYSRSLGWLVFDGRRFEVDANGAAERRAHDTARGLLQRAGRLLVAASRANAEQQKSLTAEAKVLESWAKKSQGAPRIAAALSVAASLEGIACDANAFDLDPWVLNVANGTIDLRNGVLHPHRREQMLTRLAPVVFDPSAQCPTWDLFLGRVFDSREDLIGFVQRAVGYSLTGSNAEQCFFVCHGTGANGKSTLLEALRNVLGDYALNTPTDTFMRIRDGRGAENDIARLRGARFVSAVESGEGRKLDEERIKRLTGGDMVTARYLYKEHFEFVPICKVWLGVNDKPEITGVDHGIWRRVRLIPFDVTIPAHEQDRELGAKLAAEAPGILAWALRGCIEWQRSGLGAPAAVTDGTAEWRRDANLVAAYVDECCTVAEGLSSKGSALFGSFSEWAKEQGFEPMGGKAFAARLRALGFKHQRTKKARVWRGLSPRTEGYSDEG